MESNEKEFETTLLKCEDMSRVATIEDVKILAGYTDSIIGKVSDTIGKVSATVERVMQLQACVEVECARLDHALDCLLAKAKHDLSVYEKSLPILDKQFSMCQARMDNLIDRALEMMGEDLSENSLSRQEAVMGLIELTNRSLNMLIAKLMPQY